MENSLKLYGPAWSAYVRTVRLTLTEKAVSYELVDVDFSKAEMPAAQLQRHPFAKVPALLHGDFSLYETSAICRYIDTAFTGPSLQPADARQLARMSQIIALLDTYLSAEIRKGFVYEGLFKPMTDVAVDRERLAQSTQAIDIGFAALANLPDGGQFMVGDQVTLADLHAIPLFDYLSLTPGGSDLIKAHNTLDTWWTNIRNRDSVLQTSYELSAFSPQWRQFLSPSDCPAP